MLHIVRSDTPLDISLIENDLIKSVTQNLLLLISTRKGTIPMYREFGLPMTFIDKPTDVEEALIVSEITEAVEEFEPRCELKNIEFEPNASMPWKLTVILGVEIPT